MHASMALSMASRLLVSYKTLANPQRRTFGKFAPSTADQALFRSFWSRLSFTPCVHAISAASRAAESSLQTQKPD